jgi:hypothetical protein
MPHYSANDVPMAVAGPQNRMKTELDTFETSSVSGNFVVSSAVPPLRQRSTWARLRKPLRRISKVPSRASRPWNRTATEISPS